MILLQGKGVSKGVVKGTLYFIRPAETAAVPPNGAGAKKERARLEQAQGLAVDQLKKLAQQCRERLGDESADLFETHAMFVYDEDYVEYILNAIDEENCSAEYAVQAAAEQFASMFAGMNDDYMQARAADIRDVSDRIIANLSGEGERKIDFDAPVILAADDLAPSQTVQLDKR